MVPDRWDEVLTIGRSGTTPCCGAPWSAYASDYRESSPRHLCWRCEACKKVEQGLYSELMIEDKHTPHA